MTRSTGRPATGAPVKTVSCGPQAPGGGPRISTPNRSAAAPIFAMSGGASVGSTRSDAGSPAAPLLAQAEPAAGLFRRGLEQQQRAEEPEGLPLVILHHVRRLTHVVLL